MFNLSINNSKDRSTSYLPRNLFQKNKIPTIHDSKPIEKNTSITSEQLCNSLCLVNGPFSKRKHVLSSLFFSSLFPKAANDMKLNAKHALNYPYPITKESLLNAVDSINQEFYEKSQYKIEVNKNVNEKIESFLNTLKQDLPLTIKTPFKCLSDNPQIMQNGNVVLLSAQIEGGIDTWLGGEIICKSVLIALKKSHDGKFIETDHVLPDRDYGFKSVLSKETESKLSAKVNTCTYSGSNVDFDIDVTIDENGKISINKKC